MWGFCIIELKVDKISTEREDVSIEIIPSV